MQTEIISSSVNSILSRYPNNDKMFEMAEYNDKHNIIISLHKDPIKKLEEIFNRLFTNENVTISEYELFNIFKMAESRDKNCVSNLVVNSLSKHIDILKEAIQDLDDIDIAVYNQITKSYSKFTQSIINLLKKYDSYLVKTRYVNGIYQVSPLSIIQKVIFYVSLVDDNDVCLLDSINIKSSDINKNNIEQLFEYIESIKSYELIRNFTRLDVEQLESTIKKCLSKVNTVNIICAYIHDIIKSLSNNYKKIKEYETLETTEYEKKIIGKIYKTINVISKYSDVNIIFDCYKKYLQVRIVEPNYDNLEVEIDIIKKMSKSIGAIKAQELINQVGDIVYSVKSNSVIKNHNINIKSEKYKSLGKIDPSILSPITINRYTWTSLNKWNIEPKYPVEMECYFAIIDNSYKKMFDNKYTIDWQPTMGSATFTATLNEEEVTINCNILQAILLMAFNDNKNLTVEKFSSDYNIKPDLSSKLFESLFNLNILTSSIDISDNIIYSVNVLNYQGPNTVNAYSAFIETFRTTNNE